MNTSDLENFDVVLEGDRLSLKVTGPMPEPAVQYLQGHLDRLNKFKHIGWWRGARAVSFFDPPLPSGPGKRGLIDRLERVFLKVRKPAAATLAITYACQADCVHCSCQRNVLRQPPLTTEQWKRIVSETIDLGTTNVIFTGGEPMLRKDIYELVAHVDKQRATALLFSNGELLTPEACRRLVDAGLYAVFVSLDSTTAEEHDRLRRRPGLYARLMENIRNVQDAGIMIGFSIYLSHAKYRAGDLERYMELGKKLGINEIVQFDCVPTGRLFGQMDLLLTPEDREEIRQKTLTYFRDKSYPSLTSQALVNSPASMGCFGAFNQFYMTAYGDMCPCDFTPISFGNGLKEGVQAVWERMTHHPLWCKRHKDCRMQTPEFRAKTVDRIPEGAPMPYPIALLDGATEDTTARPACTAATL